MIELPFQLLYVLMAAAGLLPRAANANAAAHAAGNEACRYMVSPFFFCNRNCRRPQAPYFSGPLMRRSQERALKRLSHPACSTAEVRRVRISSGKPGFLATDCRRWRYRGGLLMR